MMSRVHSQNSRLSKGRDVVHVVPGVDSQFLFKDVYLRRDFDLKSQIQELFGTEDKSYGAPTIWLEIPGVIVHRVVRIANFCVCICLQKLRVDGGEGFGCDSSDGMLTFEVGGADCAASRKSASPATGKLKDLTLTGGWCARDVVSGALLGFKIMVHLSR